MIEQASFLSGIVSEYDGIRRPWIGDTSDPLYKQYKYHTGIDIYGDKVFSYADGIVLAVGKEDNRYAITIQYDVFSCLRYMNLKSVSVKAGDVVQAGFLLGSADKYVHFEFINKYTSMWSVRIGKETYYKHNPIDMIGGGS